MHSSLRMREKSREPPGFLVDVKRVLDRILHLYHYQWKDGLTLVCVGGSEDMDWEQLFTIAFIVVII